MHNNLVLKPKRAKGDDGYKTFSIRIKEELAAELDEISSKTSYSRNELIGVMIEYGVEHCIIED